MKIALGCDHGGFEYKEAIKKHLIEKGYEVLDQGPFVKEPVDYPIFGIKAARAVASGQASYGIVVCTTGEGISIAANKVKGIRCGIGYNDAVTEKIREHNNCNMIAFGQAQTVLVDVLRRVDIFLNTPFAGDKPEGARHAKRVQEIADAEKC